MSVDFFRMDSDSFFLKFSDSFLRLCAFFCSKIVFFLSLNLLLLFTIVNLSKRLFTSSKLEGLGLIGINNLGLLIIVTTLLATLMELF